MNIITITGNLTADPELRYTPNGKAACSFTVGVRRKRKNAQGERISDFIKIEVPPLFSATAEYCGNNLKKGTKVAVNGELHIDKVDRQGETRWYTKIEAETVEKETPSEGSGYDSDFGSQVDFSDDDIPF